jgi:hypothetical protein
MNAWSGNKKTVHPKYSSSPPTLRELSAYSLTKAQINSILNRLVLNNKTMRAIERRAGNLRMNLTPYYRKKSRETRVGSVGKNKK